MEAAIYVVSDSGSVSGEYVASCTRNQCGYFGKSLWLYAYTFEVDVTHTSVKVFLERLYDKPGLHIRNYPRRGK